MPSLNIRYTLGIFPNDLLQKHINVMFHHNGSFGTVYKYKESLKKMPSQRIALELKQERIQKQELEISISLYCCYFPMISFRLAHVK